MVILKDEGGGNGSSRGGRRDATWSAFVGHRGHFRLVERGSFRYRHCLILVSRRLIRLKRRILRQKVSGMGVQKGETCAARTSHAKQGLSSSCDGFGEYMESFGVI